MRRCYTFTDYRGKCHGAVGEMLGVKEVWTRVSQRKRSLRKVDKGGDGNMCLEVVEMVADDLLDVDAGGMVGEDKGNPIAV
eukprot:g14464.t1